MPTAMVLGAGMVGSVIAADLAREPGLKVTAADARDAALALASQRAGGRIETRRADLSDPRGVRDLVAGFDVVVGALSSRLGLATLRAVIEAGRPYVDISFMADDAMQLDALARDKGVTAIVDCGVAPGMSNLLAGVAARRLSPCESIEIYVGGLPRERRWPFDYKAAFSPADVIEEYTRPARIIENGRMVVREALSEPELMDLPGVGTVEAFNTDGLRSIATTLKVPFMKEKTLRYPGHIALMRAFRETGLFSKEPIDVGGVNVVPLELTSRLLFPKWTYGPGEEDLTIMRVIGVGMRGGQRVRLVWDVLDFADHATGFTSMARTTGFPATIMARMILAGRVSRRGVLPPELLADDETLLRDMFAQLGARGVRYQEREEPA